MFLTFYRNVTAEDRESKYVRMLTCSLLGVKRLLSLVQPSDTPALEQKLSDLVNSGKFWKYSKHKSAQVEWDTWDRLKMSAVKTKWWFVTCSPIGTRGFLPACVCSVWVYSWTGCDSSSSTLPCCSPQHRWHRPCSVALCVGSCSSRRVHGSCKHAFIVITLSWIQLTRLLQPSEM